MITDDVRDSDPDDAVIDDTWKHGSTNSLHAMRPVSMATPPAATLHNTVTLQHFVTVLRSTDRPNEQFPKA